MDTYQIKVVLEDLDLPFYFFLLDKAFVDVKQNMTKIGIYHRGSKDQKGKEEEG